MRKKHIPIMETTRKTKKEEKDDWLMQIKEKNQADKKEISTLSCHLGISEALKVFLIRTEELVLIKSLFLNGKANQILQEFLGKAECGKFGPKAAKKSQKLLKEASQNKQNREYFEEIMGRLVDYLFEANRPPQWKWNFIENIQILCILPKLADYFWVLSQENEPRFYGALIALIFSKKCSSGLLAFESLNAIQAASVPSEDVSCLF